jgi:hypothetical protein
MRRSLASTRFAADSITLVELLPYPFEHHLRIAFGGKRREDGPAQIDQTPCSVQTTVSVSHLPKLAKGFALDIHAGRSDPGDLRLVLME